MDYVIRIFDSCCILGTIRAWIFLVGDSRHGRNAALKGLEMSDDMVQYRTA